MTVNKASDWLIHNLGTVMNKIIVVFKVNLWIMRRETFFTIYFEYFSNTSVVVDMRIG